MTRSTHAPPESDGGHRGAPLCTVRVRPATLIGTNAAVSPIESAHAYAALLVAALQAELPGVEVRVVVDDDAEGPGALVEPDPTGTLTLRAEGVARAVRHAGRWAVYQE